MTLRVAVIGDSAMWGQGLKPEHQFARIAAQQIADDLGEQLEILPSVGNELGRGYARSGAKISSDVTADQKTVLLPGGHTYAALAGDRADFALTFREYFLTDQAMIDFLTHDDDRPAADLFGEIPATFPTVNGQVRLLVEDGPTDDVRLVILDGGANDAHFEQVIDPEGPSIDAINQQIVRVFQDRLSDLLKSARKAFPNAVIIVTGYYSALSYLTHRGELKRFAEYYKDLADWKVKVNSFVNNYLPLVNYLWDATLGSDQNVDDLLENAISRTVYAVAQVHFRTRATIGSLPPQFLGPGILYAHPNFLAEHALFAGDKSLVHSGYKPPNSGSYSVSDEMLYTRVENMPRLSILNDYNSIAKDVDVILNSDTSQQQRADTVAVLRDKITALKTANSDLPGQILLATTGPYYEDDDGMKALKTALTAEFARIENTFIASFVHPNVDGAKRYADAVVTTYRRHRKFSVKDATQGMVEAGETLSLRSALPRHSLNPASGLRQLALVAYVESVAIELEQFYAISSHMYEMTFILGAGVTLEFDTFQLHTTTSPQDVLLAFDAGLIYLSQITELTVRIEDLEDDPGPPATFAHAVLYLNGHEVFRGNRADGEITASTVRFAFGTKTNA